MTRNHFPLLILMLGLPPTAGHCLETASSIQLIDRITGLSRPWGAAVLPSGRLVISEMQGTLKLFGADGQLLAALPRPADLDQRRLVGIDNAGAFDVATDPDFPRNGTIYWTYAAFDADDSWLKLVRLRIEDDRFTDPQTLWSALPAGTDRFHYGGALLFDVAGTLLVSSGERHASAALQGTDPVAQAPNDSRGKIWRLHHVADADPATVAATAEVAASGLRNVQGMAVDASGGIWFVDHGPIRGDELNRLVAGANYGWPYVTAGQYKPPGPAFEAGTVPTGYQAPELAWTEGPIAPSGLLIYQGDRFPAWNDSILISALSSGRLLRLWRDAAGEWQQEQLLLGLRLRDVLQTRDGRLLVLTDETKGRVIEVLPAPSSP